MKKKGWLKISLLLPNNLHKLLIKLDNCFQYFWLLKSISIRRFKRSDEIGFDVLMRRGHVKDPTQNVIHYHLKTENYYTISTFVSERRVNQLEFMVSKA